METQAWVGQEEICTLLSHVVGLMNLQAANNRVIHRRSWVQGKLADGGLG